MTKKQELAAAWDQGRLSALEQVKHDALEFRKHAGKLVDHPTNENIQPIRDAIDSVGTYSVTEYNDFIGWITAYSLAESLVIVEEANPYQ